MKLRVEKGQLVGNQSITDELELAGQIIGDVVVASGGMLLVRGQLIGSLLVKNGGKAEIWGMYESAVAEDGGTLIIHPDSVVLSGKA